VLPQQEVHLVKPVDVYLGGMEGVPNGREESKDFLQLAISAGFHRVPARVVFVPREVILVPILILGGLFLSLTAHPVDLSYSLLGNVVYCPALHHMSHLLRY
jgi:hypothetical protein